MTLAITCAVALVGIALGYVVHPNPMPLLPCGALALVAAWLARSRAGWRMVNVLACGLSLGAARGALPPAPQLAGSGR